MLAVDCLEDAHGPQLIGFGKKTIKLTGLWPRVHQEYKFSDQLVCFASSVT
jgi:hypothetical protein